MVKRKVKLAQVVCAVYSLNKPNGATKREIVKFCKKRFGCTCSSKEFNHLLERGEDEGLLTSFRQRYRVTKLRFELLWGENVSVTGRKKKAVEKRKRRRGIKKGIERKKTYNRKSNNFLKRRVKLEEDSFKKNSSLYELWKIEVQRQIKIMRERKKNVSKQGKSLCKPRNNHRAKSKILLKKFRHKSLLKKPKCQCVKQITRRNFNNKKIKCIRQKGKKMEKSKVFRLKKKSTTSLKKGIRKKKSRQTNSRASRASSHKGELDQNSEFQKTLMRQTKHAVVHGESWDQLNYARQKRMRENQELVKKSRLIQKILTETHAKSWDDLNTKLKDLKTPNCNPQEVKQDGGDGAPLYTLTSLYPL